MKEYMYLFRGGDAQRVQQSPEEMQEHLTKWNIWMEKLRSSGHMISGLPLHDDGKVVRKQGAVVTDGPFTEGKEIVAGYLIVKANDLDHATEMSKACPIFEHDGIVEVREILPFDPD